MKSKNSKTCEGCNADCCRYVALEIDCPEDLDDFENIKWYVSHEKVVVYVEEDGVWTVLFETPCKYLGKNNLCENYEKRPKICKDYAHDECTFHNQAEYKELYTFRTIEEVEKYIEEIFKKGKHIFPAEDEE